MCNAIGRKTRTAVFVIVDDAGFGCRCLCVCVCVRVCAHAGELPLNSTMGATDVHNGAISSEHFPSHRVTMAVKPCSLIVAGGVLRAGNDLKRYQKTRVAARWRGR